MQTTLNIRSDYVEATIQERIAGDEPPEVPGTGPVQIPCILHTPAYYRLYEEKTPDETGPRTQWKSFEHYKRVMNPTSGGFTRLSITEGANPTHTYRAPYFDTNISLAEYNNEYGVAGSGYTAPPSFYEKRQDGGFVPPIDDLQLYIDRSLDSMLPKIKPELSIINSIIELKDFKSLPETIRNIAKLGVKYLSFSAKTISLLRAGASLKELLRAGADGYLQAKFNILPLLSDIRGIKNALKRTERRLNDFITRAGSVQKRHWSAFVQESAAYSTDETNGSPGMYSPGNYYAVSFRMRRFQTLAPTVFHAEIEYNYNYTQYQLEHARILALLDAVGVNFNPAIIWNAVPWSFVVDWVLGVSQWLNKQRIGLMDPQINIHRYLWSIKRRRDYRVERRTAYLLRYDTNELDVSQWFPLMNVSESAYRRNVGFPSASSIISSGLNSNELSLGAALVIARRSRQQRRSRWPVSFTLSI